MSHQGLFRQLTVVVMAVAIVGATARSAYAQGIQGVLEALQQLQASVATRQSSVDTLQSGVNQLTTTSNVRFAPLVSISVTQKVFCSVSNARSLLARGKQCPSHPVSSSFWMARCSTFEALSKGRPVLSLVS